MKENNISDNDNNKAISVSKSESNKSKIFLIVILWILTAVIFTAVGAISHWFFTRDKSDTNDNQSNETNNKATQEDNKEDEDNNGIVENNEYENEEEAWNTYSNSVIGYQIQYPDEYELSFDDELKEECVRLENENISINFGLSDSMQCLRTGIGAYEIDETEVSYNINGQVFTIDEWYEHAEQEDGTFGNVYGRIHLDDTKKLDVEYYGHPKDTFETERETIDQILESITW